MTERTNPRRALFGALTLAYNQEEYLEAMLRGIAPHCARLYVMHSQVPFTRYNPQARGEFTRADRTAEILARLQRELPHLAVRTGEWACEDDMRNAGLDAAMADGLDYLMVVDADEFYRDGVVPAVQRSVLALPEADSWWCRTVVPFKRCDYVIDRDDEYLPVAVRLDPAIRFTNRRIPAGRRARLPQELAFFNMGFLLPDARMYEKTRTWSHAHQLPGRWFEEKWLGWSPATRNLHTRVPELWPRCRPFHPAALPQSLAGHPLVRLPGA